MSLRSLTTLAATTAVLVLAGCDKKLSDAEKDAQERAQIREKKRVEAIKLYKDLSSDFPDSPKAQDARAAAAALEAAAPKK